MLTTAPRQRGDLTILSAGPAKQGLTAFSKVRYTIHAGQVIYQR